MGLYELLEKSGDVADAGQDSMGCEFFYQIFNTIDKSSDIISSRESIDTIINYFTPLSIAAMEQKRCLEAATVGDLIVPVEKETKLFTNSKGFNTNPKNTNGQFKRFGVDGHGPQLPEVHVHQSTRNVSPKTGIIYGGQGTTPLVDVTFPNNKDIKQLYEYLNNGKYR